jgi:hypothetical protein
MIVHLSIFCYVTTMSLRVLCHRSCLLTPAFTCVDPGRQSRRGRGQRQADSPLSSLATSWQSFDSAHTYYPFALRPLPFPVSNIPLPSRIAEASTVLFAATYRDFGAACHTPPPHSRVWASLRKSRYFQSSIILSNIRGKMMSSKRLQKVCRPTHQTLIIRSHGAGAPQDPGTTGSRHYPRTSRESQNLAHGHPSHGLKPHLPK